MVHQLKRCTVILAALLLIPALAHGQASRLGSTTKLTIGNIRNPSVAYDSVNGVYLAITGQSAIQGQFVNAAGAPLGAPFRVDQTPQFFSQTTRVAFNAATQTFLVTWHSPASASNGRNVVKARLVKYGSGPIGTEQVVSTPGSFWEFGASVASSANEFMVTWTVIDTGGNYNIYARRIGTNGVPQGAIIAVSVASEFEREPAIAYNANSNEYLIVWAGSSDAPKYGLVRYRRFQPGSDTPLGGPVQITKVSSTLVPAVTVNTTTFQYLVTWYQTAGVQAVYGCLLNSDGSVAKAPYAVNTKFAFYDANDIAFNPVSNTYFGVGHGATVEDTGFEVGSAGTPSAPFYITNTAGLIAGKTINGNYNPRVVANAQSKTWLVVTATNHAALAAQLIQTATQDNGGGNPPPPPPPPPPGSQPVTALDAPTTGATVTLPLTISGWAVDRGATSGTGVDAVHVYAYPNPGSGQPAVFLGVAAYGAARSDVGAQLGAQFTNSGFTLSVDGLDGGKYLVVAFAHSVLTNSFNSKAATITVKNSAMSLDTPSNGTSGAGPFFVSGWAIDNSGATGTGVDAVHVYAYPNPGSNQAPIFLGVAGYGLSRTDVASLYGSSRFQNSGFLLSVTSLTTGTYRIVAFAHSAVQNAFTSVRTADITIAAGPRLAIDTPADNATVGPGFAVNGWAIDLTAPSGTGVDAVHVWAYPLFGGNQLFLGAAQLGFTRADVANVFGARAMSSGFSLATAPLPSGRWAIHVFARSTATGTFNNVATRIVTVP